MSRSSHGRPRGEGGGERLAAAPARRKERDRDNQDQAEDEGILDERLPLLAIAQASEEARNRQQHPTTSLPLLVVPPAQDTPVGSSPGRPRGTVLPPLPASREKRAAMLYPRFTSCVRLTGNE